MLTRRSLFGILAGAVAAPIVVRSGLLMPVKALVVPEFVWRTGTWTARYYTVVAVTRDDATAIADALNDSLLTKFTIPGNRGLKIGDVITVTA